MEPTTTNTRGERRTRYLHELARAAACWRMDCYRDEAVVEVQKQPDGRTRAHAWGPAHTARPEGFGRGCDEALVALFEACKLPPSARLACVERAARATGVWVPLPGEELDREGHVALAVAPHGRAGWTVTDLRGQLHPDDTFTARAAADRVFEDRAGRPARLRPAGLPVEVLLLPLGEP